MDVSSSTSTNTATASVDAMKKAIDTQEQQVLSVLDSSQKQTQQQVQQQNQQTTAQKTGMGNSLNLMG
jgi:hemerythrin-like domain-containing protein